MFLIYEDSKLRFIYEVPVTADLDETCSNVANLANSLPRWRALADSLTSHPDLAGPAAELTQLIDFPADRRSPLDTEAAATAASRLQVAAEAAGHTVPDVPDRWDPEEFCLWFTTKPLRPNRPAPVSSVLGANESTRAVVRPSASRATGAPPKKVNESEQLRYMGFMRRQMEKSMGAEDCTGVGTGGWGLSNSSKQRSGENVRFY